MIPTQLTIDGRYNGPPYSGNGGYSCGIIGQYIDGPAEVMLRIPPPLDKLMAVTEDGENLQLLADDTLVAIARPHAFHLDLPEPISIDAASSASKQYIGFDQHHFGTCFVCGPERVAGDGLRIFAGDTNVPNVVAAPWIPSDDLFNDNDQLKPEFFWSAMDCPSYFALLEDKMIPMVLGKMACHIENDIHKGESIVVMAWKIKVDGRKYSSATVLYGADGTLKSYSQNLWIALTEEQIQKISSAD